MEAKDILRIALFVLVALFALRSGSLIKIRKAERNNYQEENEEAVSQQLLQQSLDTRNRANQEPMVYENKNSVKEMSETSGNVNVSSGAINMIVTLLMIFI